MSFLWCCPQSQSSEEERQPILGLAVSTRTALFLCNDSQLKSHRVTMRHVGVPDLDQCFSDFAEMFNKQQEQYERMQEQLKSLKHHYRSDPDCSFSECLQNIKHEHDNHELSLQMKGYDFNLTMSPNDPVPDKLKRTQESINELCQAVKAIVTMGSKLEEMINWLLKSEQSLTQTVNKEDKSYQERKRLGDNLKKNLYEASRAKELSPHYRKEAGKLFNEVALLSGVQP